MGGLTRGLRDAGIVVRAGIDIDMTCKFAYEYNNEGSTFYNEDVTRVTATEITKLFDGASVRVLAGCAPCQPFSRFTYRDKTREKTARWRLLEEFARLVDEVNPDIVSMENVPQLEGKEPFEIFLNTLSKKGYYVNYGIVDCSKYGVPQSRKRLVLLASKYGEIELIPATHENPITVRTAIGALGSLVAGEKDNMDSLHRCQNLSDKNLDRIRMSKPGHTWKDWPEDMQLKCHKKEAGQSFRGVYGRMNWDLPAPTITTQFFNYGSGRFGHPEQDRAMSLREGALLQSFPLNYKFTEKEDYNLAAVAVHIGNAVPVKLGKAIGASIKKHLVGNNVIKIYNEN